MGIALLTTVGAVCFGYVYHKLRSHDPRKVRQQSFDAIVDYIKSDGMDRKACDVMRTNAERGDMLYIMAMTNGSIIDAKGPKGKAEQLVESARGHGLDASKAVAWLRSVE